MSKKIIFATNIKFFLLVFIVALSFFAYGKAKAGSDDNVSGWAWSENIGWISFNNTTGGGEIDYGVDVNSEGIFSGHAWSENIGWISFERSDTGPPPAPPYDGSEDFIAKLDFSTNEVSGWAKAIDADAWIKLRNGTYGVYLNPSTSEFEDWAWSDTLIGWISFNCINTDTCEESDYKVILNIDTIDPVVDTFDVDPKYPDWSNDSIDISWIVTDSGGSHLSHVEIWKASYNDTDCSDTNKEGCEWSKVNGNYYVEGEVDEWTSSVQHSKNDYLEDGTWWYGLHVLDNDGNWGDEGGPIKIRVDSTAPNSQIQGENPSGSWQKGNFIIDTLDEDLGSGLDPDSCEYKILFYTCYPPNPDCEYKSKDSSRTCNDFETITVGPDEDCPYQGEQSCWVYIRSKDNAGNQSLYEEGVSIKDYSIDWTEPSVGKISPLIAVQGIEQAFSATLTDPVGRISGCWLYVDEEPEKPADSISPSPCKNGDDCTVSVNHTFASPGDHDVHFSCSDAANNVAWGEPVTIKVIVRDAPVITSLNYYSCHSSTPEQECTNQFACCTEPTTQTDCDVKFNISAYDPDGDPLIYTWDFDDGTPDSNDEDPSHHYTNADTYNVLVDVSNGIEHVQDTLVVTVNNPTISVSLTADPAFGIDSLSDVDLRGIVTGSMFGTINYKFDCTSNDSWELEASSQSTDDYTAYDLCNYSIGGHTAKVFVQRGEGSDEDTVNINVVASECSPGEQTDCTSPQGCSHTITCQADSTWPDCPTDECTKDSVRNCGNCGEQTCLSTCQWGDCSGEGECVPGSDCPDCLCPPDACLGQDYYDYPDFGDCSEECSCDTGLETGEPCEPDITINDPQCNEAPVCDSLGASPEQGVAPLEVLFTGSGHDNDGTITNYGFIFGDGESGTSTDNTINHVYNDPGTYCAKLKVQDDSGAWTQIPGDCPSVCSKQINIDENHPPEADISCDAETNCYPGSQCNGSWIFYNRNCNFSFLNQSTDDDNNIIKSTWSIFYQGSTQDPLYSIICIDDPETPENEGMCDSGLIQSLPASQYYYVNLIVEDSVGATNDYSRNFYIRNEVAADFQCSLNPEEGWQSCDELVVSEGEVVYFQDNSVPSEGSTAISSWEWSFEDGDPGTSSEQNPSASFVNVTGSSGTITLDVTDNIGRTDTEQYQLQITIPLPQWEEVVPL